MDKTEMNQEEKETLFQKVLKRKRLIIVLAVLLIAAFLVWKLVLKKKDDSETTTVERGTVAEELILSGEIKADEHAELNFSSSGKIIWVGVSEGEWVKKGQALAKLDTINLNADYQRAKADLRDAEATLARVHDDVKDHSGDETYTQKETRTTAEVAKDKAWEALIKAEENLRNATLTAPFAGLVTTVAKPFPGANVLYTESQIELVNPETIYFEVAADQSEVTSLEQGQRVVMVLDSFQEEELEGEIDFISFTPKTDEAGTVYKIKVKLTKEDLDLNKIRIGMTGDAKFILSQKEDVLFVPPDFVHSDKGGKYLFKGSKKNKVYIEVGIEGEERVEITGNIKEGDTVFD